MFCGASPRSTGAREPAVVLSWELATGAGAIPRSANPAHIDDNAAVLCHAAEQRHRGALSGGASRRRHVGLGVTTICSPGGSVFALVGGSQPLGCACYFGRALAENTRSTLQTESRRAHVLDDVCHVLEAATVHHTKASLGLGAACSREPVFWGLAVNCVYV